MSKQSAEDYARQALALVDVAGDETKAVDALVGWADKDSEVKEALVPMPETLEQAAREVVHKVLKERRDNLS